MTQTLEKDGQIAMMKPRMAILKGLLITAVLGLGFNVIGGQDPFAETPDNVMYDGSSSMSPTEFTERARLTSGSSGDNYSSLVAISGNTAVVYSGPGFHVYVRAGASWIQQAVVMTSSEGMFPFTSERSVAIDGDTIVLGGTIAETDGLQRGAAYVLVRNGSTWTQQARLIASDGEVGDRFGCSVAISGNTVVVGAVTDTVGTNTAQGSAYVFVRGGEIWSEQTKILAPDGITRHQFGYRVALSGDTLAISRQRFPAFPTVSVYVFVRSGTNWVQQGLLSVCEPSGSDGTICNFGRAIALSGDTIAVGNDSLNVAGRINQGGVYVFTRTGNSWNQQQRITAADGLDTDTFGTSVSVSNDIMAIGASAINTRPGSVYLYSRSGGAWSMSQPRIQKASPITSNLLGASVALSQTDLIFGAVRDAGTTASPVGAAYIYGSGTVIPTTNTPFDFDGDHKTDISIFRPGPGEWWWLRSSDGGNGAVTFGSATDKLVPGDYTGDGKADIAVWRPSNGNWFILRSEDSSFYAFPFGSNGDVPVAADFDGDGKTDAGVFRPTDVTWYISRSSGGTTITAFGAAGDQPVPADYDGDGKADVAIFRPNGGGGSEWWIQRSSTSTVFAALFGAATDKTVVGDHTGDGKADIAIWRPSSGDWFILRSEDLSFYAFPFGANGDLPTPGDYDGDGKTDAAVFRPSNSTWYAQRSTAGTLIQQFGQTGDVPVPSAFVR